jgi:hypothetical protein
MTAPGQPDDRILKRARELAAAERIESSTEARVGWAYNVLTLVELLRGRDHEAVEKLRDYIDASVRSRAYDHTFFVTAIRGAALGLQNDIESGFLPDLPTRIRGEIEGDFLAQAHRLLEHHQKDPAAMLIGAVLEDALRQLCRKHSVAEGNSIEAMNEPLRTGGVYGLPQKQQVTAWAAIRNNADHGRFNGYTEPEVRLMHQGVAGFVATYLGG